MLTLIRKNAFYFIPFLVLFIASILYLANTEHGAFLRWLNSYSTSFLNVFFQVITFIGDGLPIVILSLLVLLFHHLRFGLGLLLAFLSSGVLSQLVKRTVAAPRPKAYFTDFDSLNLIPDFYYSSSFSFPSGHTATAFAFFTFLALMTKSKFLQIIYLTLAILAAISRVYLLQHFLIDITAGAVLGVFCALFVFLQMEKINSKQLDQSGIAWFKMRKNKKAQPL